MYNTFEENRYRYKYVGRSKHTFQILPTFVENVEWSFRMKYSKLEIILEHFSYILNCKAIWSWYSEKKTEIEIHIKYSEKIARGCDTKITLYFFFFFYTPKELRKKDREHYKTIRLKLSRKFSYILYIEIISIFVLHIFFQRIFQ